MAQKNINIQSVQSLHITMLREDLHISTGTGFAVQSKTGPVLITNRHNVTGRHQATGQPLSRTGAIPEAIGVMHSDKGRVGQWYGTKEPLYDHAGKPLWFEHPVHGAQADFVALPLTDVAEVDLHPHDPWQTEPDIRLMPADVVSVVGFPFGESAGGFFGIWATGFIASEPNIDYGNLPCFLIDCRTRRGQSGSPVIFYRNGGSIPMRNGDTAMFTGVATKLLGIYSGRINAESDIGIVWKASAIAELVTSIPERAPS